MVRETFGPRIPRKILVYLVDRTAQVLALRVAFGVGEVFSKGKIDPGDSLLVETGDVDRSQSHLDMRNVVERHAHAERGHHRHVPQFVDVEAVLFAETHDDVMLIPIFGVAACKTPLKAGRDGVADGRS